MTVFEWKTGDGEGLNWNRSFSEPDLASGSKQNNRFAIKHPHEYIAVDDLKFFRRRQPLHLHTHSNIYLNSGDEPSLPFGSLKSEYRKHFRAFGSSYIRPSLLRRATSLRLEGFMQLLSEHQEKYHWFTPEDLQYSRAEPVRNPENLRPSAAAAGGGGGGGGDMKNSSYLTYPMADASAQILPREIFREDDDDDATPLPMGKLAADKFKRDVAAQEQQKCHLQLRAEAVPQEPTPSEYKRQFVQFPIEKAHSIPQMSSIKIQGKFVAVPEYQDSFKMYANYSKSAPIKKHDNLRLSGTEQEPHDPHLDLDKVPQVPEYRDKFNDPPKHMAKEKSLKTDDHLHPRGEFSKDVPEYYESFRDPQIKEMPERGKCREPYLRLRGKIEFCPEYRNTYLDFPRSRPVVRKPPSSFRLPVSGVTPAAAAAAAATVGNDSLANGSQPEVTCDAMQVARGHDLIGTPEYRRAQFNYQLRERTPTRNHPPPIEKGMRKSSDSSLERQPQQATTYKRRTSRHRQPKEPISPQVPITFDGDVGGSTKKPARFGRRASVLQNAANCREHSSIIEGNPKYGCRRAKHNTTENQQESFVVLDEPCKPSNWMKQSWYDS